MERLNRYCFALLFPATVASALLSFALCVAAEFKKSKKNDLRMDGKLCYLPGSAAFALGIGAVICLSIGQFLGSSLICRKFRSREQSSSCQVRIPTVSRGLLVLSWISFGIAVILISGATSMSRRQPFGEGWLDGECYLVRDGVYVGSALLALLAVASTLGSVAVTPRRRKAEENMKVRARHRLTDDKLTNDHSDTTLG